MKLCQWWVNLTAPCSQLTRSLDSDIVVRVDTDVVLLEAEGVLTAVYGLELVMILQVRPPPEATVDDVGKTLPMRDLIK